MVPARDVVTRALGEILRRQPMSPAKVELAWRSAVGTAIARVTGVALDHRGTLHVSVETEEWRRAIERAVPVIRKRLAAMLGPDDVKRIALRGG